MAADALDDALNKVLMSAREHECDEHPSQDPAHQSCACCCWTCEANAMALYELGLRAGAASEGDGE